MHDISPYVPSVPYHLTFGQLTRLLADLPQDATLYGCDLSYDDGSGTRIHYYPDFLIDRSEWAEWDVSFSTAPSDEPVTVGEFLDFLMESLGTEIEPDDEYDDEEDDEYDEDGEEKYSVTEECYVWMGDNDAGAINGIRLNADGTYAISTKDASIVY